MKIGDYVYVRPTGKREVVRAEVVETGEDHSLLVCPEGQSETTWHREDHEWWFTESGAWAAMAKWGMTTRGADG